MIVDQFENAGLYGQLSERFAIAMDYLKKTDLNALAAGKHEISGTDVFVSVSEYQTKNVGDAKWEAHSKYADIQIVVSGEEKMGFAPLKVMDEKEPYNNEKDIVILTGHGDFVTVKPGTFVVFFPHDAHQPGVASGNPSKVKKAVIKVKVV